MVSDKHSVNVNELTFETIERVKKELKRLIDVGGSDLHIKANAPIKARVNGVITMFNEQLFSKADGITLAKELLRTRFSEFVEKKEMDLVYIYDEKLRFRVNIFFQMDGVSAVFRAIPSAQKTLQEMGLPETLRKIIGMDRGIVLVTGATGSGKSTTLASIIHEINLSKSKHIITIEDPIEFMHKDIKCVINQRSVGQDTNSFQNALKGALREDPDIILVGEMRDIETIEMALHAAETGHLVFSTLHTMDAKETLNRIVSVFPPHEQHRIRLILSSTISAIVAQRLIRTKAGGRIAAVEVLYKTPRIESLIREGRDSEIPAALAEGRSIYGTQTFDQALFEFVTNGIVDEDVALSNASVPSDLKLRLSNDFFKNGGENAEEMVIGLKK
ncbi:MAG: type IV pilus twitching motility protein PilT [Wolinella sp.]